MRILVTGASGQLGGKVREHLAAAGFTVQGLAHRRPGPELVAADLTDPAALKAAWNAFGPEVAVHCAAVRDPDLCEQDPFLAKRVNVDGTANLLALAGESGTRVIFISSDYVFDGRRPPYDENSRVSPVNYYGRTKVEGEKAVRAAGARRHAILRLPLLFNRDRLDIPSYLGKLIAVLREGQPVTLDHRLPRQPTLVDDVARAITLLVVEELAGVFHFAGEERLTQYEAARRVGAILGLEAGHLAPGLEPPAPEPGKRAARPLEPRLDCAKMAKLGLRERTPFEKAVWDYWRRCRQAGS